MANMHLVTGHAGKEHITAADHGSLMVAMLGDGQFVLDKGNKFAASIISDNLVRVLDGDLMMQGRHCRIADNEYVDLVIENGTQGYMRRDLIVARYTKNEETGIEEMNLVVLIGEPVPIDPVDPEYVTGNIITDGALTNDVPLYRVNIDGVTITGLDTLYGDVFPKIPDSFAELTKRIDLFSLAAYIQQGSYIGTGTCGESYPNSLTFDFVPKLVLIVLGDLGTTTNLTRNTFYFFFSFCLTEEYAYKSGFGQSTSADTVNIKDIRAKLVDKTLSWYYDTDRTDQGSAQHNGNNSQYSWIAIG